MLATRPAGRGVGGSAPRALTAERGIGVAGFARDLTDTPRRLASLGDRHGERGAARLGRLDGERLVRARALHERVLELGLVALDVGVPGVGVARDRGTTARQEQDEPRQNDDSTGRRGAVICSSGPQAASMPLVQHSRREIHFKLVYYGPGLGGKTTNLEFIHKHSRPDRRGKLISLAAESERTLFFDLLPVDLGEFKGYQVRLHLCTVPGQIAQDKTRRLVLRHVDGIVFVVDSQRPRLEDNVQSVIDLDSNLRQQGDDPDRLPLVVQYNKRDLDDIAPVGELRRALRIPRGVPEFEAIAVRGVGVFDTMKAVLKQCLNLIGDPRNAKEGRSPSILPGARASMFPRERDPDGPPTGGARLPRAPRLPSFDDDE